MAYETDGEQQKFPDSNRLPNGATDDVDPEMLLARTIAHAENCTIFRAAVFQKLMKHGALQAGDGWAMFELDGDGQMGDMALLGETTRLLIHTQKGSQDSWLAGFRVPYVRIITNEFVMNDEDSLSVFGQDFNLSPDGRALYFSSMAERQQINDNDSIVPVIRIEAGEISVTARALHIAELLFKGFGTDSLLPFGSPDRLKDAQYALDRGKTLLEQVVDQVPAAVSTP